MGFVEISQESELLENCFLWPKLCVCVCVCARACAGWMFSLLGLSPETRQQSCPSFEIQRGQ